MRNNDTQPFPIALIGKVFCKALAQLARVVADDVVLDGAVARAAVEYVYSNLMFAYFVLPSLDGFSNHKKEKLRQKRGSGKMRSGDNARGQTPAWVVVEPTRRSLGRP